jgi:RNA polymerase nonessential primary-like sigma factor
MDTPIGAGGEKSLLDTVADEGASDPADLLQDDAVQDPSDDIQDEDIHTNLEHWLDKLNDKQREVVERRFGLHGYEHSTLERVAQELGVTRERVRQIQMDALRRLRDILEKEGFSVDSFFK